ncbi:FMN-binding negative transcriptional regulator [Kribbella sp. CA-294648]|uniref:FMN-binding negative transcriptional regulator n=1 Tax=Kribbella sp. CA-294648 TaxID=3239948 RepID=UPI003D939EBF
MAVTRQFAADSATVDHLLDHRGAGELVTATASGVQATFLPFVHHRGVAGRPRRLAAHVARNNAQWQLPVVGDALFIVSGPDAYVSPSWYAAKAEHGRVVPTWNYVTVYLYGKLVIHGDVGWLERHVRELTGRFESDAMVPWSVDDAPAGYVAGLLKAIVGVELVVSRIEAKAKLSQNRSDADVSGVIAGLERASRHEVVRAMREFRGQPRTG